MLKDYFLTILMALMITAFANAQVVISPTAVFLERNSQVGSFYVTNPAESEVEVSLSFDFAYPATNENGDIYLNYEDTTAADRLSLKPYLRAFPTNFSLQSGERQTIRLIGRIPQEFEPGMYWTRMRVTSSQAAPPIDATTTEDNITAQIGFEINQVTAVFAKHKEVNTGLQINNIRATVSEEVLTIMTDVERTGNTPFFGSTLAVVRNSNGVEVAQRNTTTTVYFRNNHKIDLQIPELDSGTYTVELTYQSSRNDIAAEDIVQIQPITRSTTFTIE